MKASKILVAFFVLQAAISLACSGGDGEKDSVTGDDGVAPDVQTEDAPPDIGPDDTVQDDASPDDVGPDDLPPPEVPVIGGCPIFPADNPWNTPVDALGVHPRSGEYIATIGPDSYVHADFGTVWEGAPIGIPYVVVPESQAMVDVVFDYADESDPGPYPIPPDAPIEGGPDSDGDRHVLVIRQGACILYELFYAYPQADGSWTAGSGAIWHLDQNEVRPAGWTSADAAGLAILPGLVKYEETVEQGEIRHAIRVTVSTSQDGYIGPASHAAGSCDFDSECPPMGLRLRLRADFDVSTFDPVVQVILVAMKRYGLIVADNGSDMFISGAPDDRWNDDVLHTLHDLTASDFEAVYTGEITPY